MPYSYAMYCYAGYAKHGYVTWLCHCGHVGYAKFGYDTWLRHIRLRLLRQTRLRNTVTPNTRCAQGVKNYEKYKKNLFHLHHTLAR